MTATKPKAPTKKAATKTKAIERTVTKCPPAKAKGAKTTAEVPSPKCKPGAAKKPAAKKSNSKGGVWALSDFANDDVITVVTAKPYEEGAPQLRGSGCSSLARRSGSAWRHRGTPASFVVVSPSARLGKPGTSRSAKPRASEPYRQAGQQGPWRLPGPSSAHQRQLATEV